jgi:hypothetical protein
MLFRDFNGNLYLSAHSHREVNGHYLRIPHLFRVDDSSDRLRLLP